MPTGKVRREDPEIIINNLCWNTPEFMVEIDEVLIDCLEQHKSWSQIEADVSQKLREPISGLLEFQKTADPVTQRLIDSLISEMNIGAKASSIVLHYMPTLCNQRGIQTPKSFDRKPYRPLIRLRRRR